MERKFQKNFFVPQRISSEYVAIIASVKKRIIVIGSQWVNKKSQDSA